VPDFDKEKMVKIIRITEADRQRWNDFVAQTPAFALMQSFEWGEFKERLGWKAIRLAAQRAGRITAAAQLLVKRAPLGLFSVGYVPRGPLVDWQDTAATTALLKRLHRVARRHRALFTRIEPPVLHSPQAHQTLRRYGFRASEQTNQPRCTLMLDLEPDMDTLFANLPKKTRYHIRSCKRKGVMPRREEETALPTFYRLMLATSERKGFAIHSQQYYEQEFKVFARQNRAALLFGDHEGEPIATEMPFVFGPYGAALHGASSNAHRNLPVGDLLTWEGISWAKEKGCRWYDLWGIPDKVGELVTSGQPIPEDESGGLWGVYYFKKGFGGQVVYYAGAYDYVYVKPAYAWATRILSGLESADVIATLLDGMAGRHDVDQA
jgi:lipid II:glycine glycyltransferase (peptidoglycan interpeptide bridge formation enzyme)